MIFVVTVHKNKLSTIWLYR